MARANLRRIYTPWTVGLTTSWTVSGVRGALNSHERGDFSTSAQLIDAMGRESRLCAVEETRLKGLFGSDFHVDAADDGKEAKAVDIAGELTDEWADMYPESELMQLWHWRLFAGFAIGENQWRRTAKRWTPHLKVWHPQWINADEDRQVYTLQTRQGEVEIPFGGGGGKWIVLGRGARPWMDGLVRSLAIPWLICYWAQRDWARYSERHGMPIIKAHIPAVADDPDRETFFEDVRNISTETTITLPSGMGVDGEQQFDIDLCEATAKTWEGFQGLLRYCADTFSIALTGSNLTTQIDSGSLAAAQEASERLLGYTKSDGKELSTQLRDQSIKKWSGFNFEGGADLAPWPHWDTEPPEDLALRAKTLKEAGEALTTLKNAGWEPEDMIAFGEQFNIALKPVEKAEPVAEPQGTPSQAPDDNPDDNEDDDDDDGQEDEPKAMSRGVKRTMSTATV